MIEFNVTQTLQFLFFLVKGGFSCARRLRLVCGSPLCCFQADLSALRVWASASPSPCPPLTLRGGGVRTAECESAEAKQPGAEVVGQALGPAVWVPGRGGLWTE